MIMMKRETLSLDDQVKALVNKIFSKIPHIDRIYGHATSNDEFKLIIIYNKNTELVWNNIQYGVNDLKTIKPDVHFDLLYFHSAEVKERPVKHGNLLLKT